MKYEKFVIEEAVRTSTSVSQVMSKLGIKQAGGSHSYLSSKIKELGISTSHFLGQGWNKGGVSNSKKSAKDILVYDGKRRAKSHQLVRAMLEMGIPHKCSECPTGTIHRGKWLTLQVDHKNGDWRDNRLENLRFLCPNCHSQTDTFGSKNVAG